MKNYEFNRNEFTWADDYFTLIQKKMNLPSWFGKNADALWDMLTGYIETPCKITLTGFNKHENEYNKHIIDLINSCFIDAQKKFPNKFTVIKN
ncbi:MAG: barstar family protein [Clostridiales bacterium]|nr:barstar family protein [Candidatus Apopatousia equi]